jgi:hypothetical protein
MVVYYLALPLFRHDKISELDSRTAPATARPSPEAKVCHYVTSEAAAGEDVRHYLSLEETES